MKPTVRWTALLGAVLMLGAIACKPAEKQPSDTAPTPSDTGSPGATTQTATTPAYEIAVIPKGTTHDFWNSVHAGALKAESELGVETIWKGPLKEDDREAQIRVVENFISRKVDGIVLAPLDDKALVSVVHSAIRAGIPVVIIDSDLQSDQYVSFVATDNFKGGQLGARRLGSLLGGKGKVMMMRYAEGSASTMQREAGFLDVMKKEYPNIEIVSSNQYGGATTEMARTKAENLLMVHGNEVDGIFCPNESTTMGMLLALRSRGLAGKITFVGFDSNDMLLEAMEKKEILGLVLQNPMRMGYLGVKTMVQHLNGEAVEKRVDTGCVVATPENMNETEIKNLLSPPLDEWLKRG